MNIILLLILPLLKYVAATRIPQIVNGDDAKKGMFPYQAAIMRGPLIYCGGSIINKCHILTAAHCFAEYEAELSEELDAGNFQVAVGNILADAKKDGQTYYIDDVLIHPDYDEFNNDLALVKLQGSIRFSRSVKPVILNDEFVHPGRAIVTGFGELEEDTGVYAKKLQFTDVEILPNKNCLDYLRSIDNAQVTDGTFVCTIEKGRGMCSGDSGGPLVVQDGKDYIQVGIVAFSEECASYKDYSFYMNVAHYKSWILRESRSCY